MAWQVEECMPLEEFDGWLAWFEVKAEREKAAIEKAKNQSRHTSSI